MENDKEPLNKDLNSYTSFQAGAKSPRALSPEVNQSRDIDNTKNTQLNIKPNNNNVQKPLSPGRDNSYRYYPDKIKLSPSPAVATPNASLRYNSLTYNSANYGSGNKAAQGKEQIKFAEASSDDCCCNIL